MFKIFRSLSARDFSLILCRTQVISKATSGEIKSFLPKLATNQGVKDILIPFAKDITKVTTEQGIKTFSVQGLKAIGGQVLKPGLKTAAKDIYAGLNLDLVPRSIGIVKDITLFSTLTSGALGIVNTALGGDEKSFLIFYAPKFNSWQDAALKLSAQAYLASTPFLSPEEGGTNLGGILPVSVNPIYTFSVGVAAFQPLLRPLLQNSPALGPLEKWLADKNVFIGGRVAEGTLGKLNRFGYEEGLLELPTQLVAGKIIGDGQWSEILQEASDKRPGAINAASFSQRIKAAINKYSPVMTAAAAPETAMPGNELSSSPMQVVAAAHLYTQPSLPAFSPASSGKQITPTAQQDTYSAVSQVKYLGKGAYNYNTNIVPPTVISNKAFVSQLGLYNPVVTESARGNKLNNWKGKLESMAPKFGIEGTILKTFNFDKKVPKPQDFAYSIVIPKSQDTPSSKPALELAPNTPSVLSPSIQGGPSLQLPKLSSGMSGSPYTRINLAGIEAMGKIITPKSPLELTRKRISDVEEIASGGYVPIKNRVDLAKVVEVPLLKGSEIFYDKNIQTFMSSANKKDLKEGYAYIMINYDTLSHENKNIINEFIKGKKGFEDIKIDRYANNGRGDYAKILIPITGQSTVPEVSSRVESIAGIFSKQKMTWATYTLEQLRKDFLSPEATITDFKEIGYYYQDGLFYLSKEHADKVKDIQVTPLFKPALELAKSSVFARSTNTIKNALSGIATKFGIKSVNEKPKENIVYWPVNIAQSPIQESKAKNILLMDGNNLRDNLNGLLESQKHLIKGVGYFVTDKFSTDLVKISGRTIDEIRNTPGADITGKGKSKNKFSDNRKLAIIFEEGGKVVAEIPNLFSASYIAQKPQILGVWLINPEIIAKEKTLPIITTEYARDFGMTLRFNPKAHFSVDDKRSFAEKQKDLKPIVTETLDGEFIKSKKLEEIAQSHNEKFTLKIDLHDYNPVLYDPDWKNGFYDDSLLINSLKIYFSYILVEKLDDREVVYASNSGLDTLPKPVFMNKVYSITPDSLVGGIRGVPQRGTPDTASIPPAKLDSAENIGEKPEENRDSLSMRSLESSGERLVYNKNIETIKKYVPPDLFGGIRKLDNNLARAQVINGKVFFNKEWIGNLVDDEIERWADHELQHIRTDGLINQDKLKYGGLYTVEDFKDIQKRIHKRYEQIKDVLAEKYSEHYKSHQEILSLLRGYQVYLEQVKRGLIIKPAPNEFIEAFKPEDLKFLDEKYLHSITKDFIPNKLPYFEFNDNSRDAPQSAAPDTAGIPPAKLDSPVKKEPEYMHMGFPITDKQIDKAFSQFFKGVSNAMRRISGPLNAYNPFSSMRKVREFVNKYPQFKAIEQDLREMTRGLERRDVEILFSLAQNYTGILKTTDDFKSLFTIIETNKKDSSLNSFSRDIITFSSIPAINEKIGSVQDLLPLAEVLQDTKDISLIKELPFDSIKSRITTTKDLKLLPELQKISGNIKGVFEIANLPGVKNLTPKFEDLKPIADLVGDNPVDSIKNANRFIFYVLKQSPKTIAEWKGLADRFSISSGRSLDFEKALDDLRIEFPEKDIINAFLKYKDGFFITLKHLKSEYGGVLPAIKKLGLETVSAGLDHSAYKDEYGYENTRVSSNDIDKPLNYLGGQGWDEDSRLFTTFEKLRNEIGADNLLKAFKERGLLRVEQSIYAMKTTPILMDVAKEIGILNFLKLEGLALMAVEKDPQSFAKGFKIVEKEFNKDIIEKVAMGDNFSDINVYSRSNFVLVSQVLGKAPSLIAAVKEIGLPRLIDVMNYGKSPDNDYLEQKPLEFVEGFNIIQKEFNDEIDKVLRNEDESTKHWVCNGLVRLSQMAKDEPKVSDFIKLFGLKDLSLAVSFSKNLSYKGFDSISTLSKFGNEIVDLSNESASFKAYAPHMVYSLYVLPGLLKKFSNTAADTKLTLKTVSEIAQAFGNPKVVEAITYYADNNDSKIKSVNDLVSLKSEVVDLSKESAAFKAYASSMAEYLPGILNKFINTAADTKLTLKTVSEIAQAFGSPKVFEVIADDTNNNDSKIKSVNDLVNLKLKISDIGKNFQNLEAKVTEAKVDNFDTRDILKLVIIDKELEYAKRATDFIIQENNQIMLQTKNILLGNLLRQAYHPEVFTSITKFAKEKVDRADSLSFFRAMNNFISQSVMEKQDTLQDWQLLLNDYTNRFGYLANKDMVLAHRYLSRNEPLEGEKLAGYALKNMGITSTGEKGIGEFELAIKSLSKKLLEEGEIKEEDINNPIAKGIIGGLTGYSSATWGHGRYKDLSVFVSEFDRAKEQGLIPALEAAYNEKYIFSVRKIGKIEFSKDVNDALLKYQNWVKQGIDLSNMPLAEQLKQFKAEIGKRLDKQLELIQDNSKDNSYVKNEISKINTLKDSLSESTDLLEVLKNVVVKMSGNIRFIEEPMAIGLIVHTLNSYPNQRIELSKVLEQGPLFNFVPKLIALKDEFIKENILKDVDKGIQKPLLSLFKFNQIEKEIKDVSYLQETAKVEAFATKGILGEMAGDIGDACYTKQHLITGIKHLTPVIFTSGKGLDKKLVGSMLILENSQDNKPVLIMRAINPRDDFISEYSSEDFVKGAIEYAEQIAKVKDAVVFAPVKVSGSITNRHGFIDTAIEKFVTGNVIKLDRTENFNGYDITNGCVAVKSGGLIGNEINNEDSSGQMKALGRRDSLDEDVELNLLDRHEEFAGLVTPASEQLEVNGKQARVISADLGNVGAYHFKSGEQLIIVVNSKTSKEIQKEGKFHEIREDYWMKQGFNQREAHVIASAEQVQKFSQGNNLTPYHLSQITNMPAAQLKAIIEENEESRKWYHAILEEANAKGANIEINKIKDYENNLRGKAEEIVLPFEKRARYDRLTKALQDIEGLEKVARTEENLRSLAQSKAMINEEIKSLLEVDLTSAVQQIAVTKPGINVSAAQVQDAAVGLSKIIELVRQRKQLSEDYDRANSNAQRTTIESKMDKIDDDIELPEMANAVFNPENINFVELGKLAREGDKLAIEALVEIAAKVNEPKAQSVAIYHLGAAASNDIEAAAEALLGIIRNSKIEVARQAAGDLVRAVRSSQVTANLVGKIISNPKEDNKLRSTLLFILKESGKDGAKPAVNVLESLIPSLRTHILALTDKTMAFRAVEVLSAMMVFAINKENKNSATLNAVGLKAIKVLQEREVKEALKKLSELDEDEDAVTLEERALIMLSRVTLSMLKDYDVDELNKNIPEELSRMPIAAVEAYEDLVKGSKNSAANEPGLGLCLTPDSLIHLSEGTKKPLIEIKQGDSVLSLNQATGKLEPRKVNALLDMGVKPVYRLTTQSGKSLKTTLNHPYLTKSGWKKLKDIKVGEEIGVMNSTVFSKVSYGSFNNLISDEKTTCFVKANQRFFSLFKREPLIMKGISNDTDTPVDFDSQPLAGVSGIEVIGKDYGRSEFISDIDDIFFSGMKLKALYNLFDFRDNFFFGMSYFKISPSAYFLNQGFILGSDFRNDAERSMEKGKLFEKIEPVNLVKVDERPGINDDFFHVLGPILYHLEQLCFGAQQAAQSPGQQVELPFGARFVSLDIDPVSYQSTSSLSQFQLLQRLPLQAFLDETPLFPLFSQSSHSAFDSPLNLLFSSDLGDSVRKVSLDFGEPTMHLSQRNGFFREPFLGNVVFTSFYGKTHFDKVVNSNFILCNRHNLSPPSYNAKYTTSIFSLSRFFLSEAQAAQRTDTSSSSDILWDKIVSIEPVGSLAVYDIEVQGTHNFVAEGIVAHNTYISQKTDDPSTGLRASRGQKTETAVPPAKLHSPDEIYAALGGLPAGVSGILDRIFRRKPQAEIEISRPDTKIVKKSLAAFEYISSSQKFSGVDLEHFVHSQHRLARKELSREELRGVLKRLGLRQELANEDKLDLAYAAIYKELAKGNYNKDIVDTINGFDPSTGKSTYSDPRLNIAIVDQSGDARSQGVYEAISNSLDALGFKIGQFGKGVKQIIDWLEPTGKDRIDVYSKKENEPAYQLTILKDTKDQNYLQIRGISDSEFRDTAKAVSARPIDKGTIVKVTTQKDIPSEDSQHKEQNSQSAIAAGIHKRFPFITDIPIIIQVGNGQPQRVNGFREKKIIVPARQKIYQPKEKEDNFVHIRLDKHNIAIVDNGKGMDARVLSGMFVPEGGTKSPEFLSGRQIDEELGKVEVVHDKNLPHRVSFARNGEVIFTVDIPQGVHPDATLPGAGGLMLELGLLLDVQESRDRIVLKVGKENGFQKGVMYAVSQILKHPELSAADKIRYINTIVIGLDGLIKGNENNAEVIKAIRQNILAELQAVIDKLRSDNFVILPYQKEFGKFKVPQGKNVLFVHENLFHWGIDTLKELGAEIVPGIKLAGDKRLPLVIVPFEEEHLSAVSKFDKNWHTLSQDERVPVIKTDRFVAIPQQFGRRILELGQKRIKGLTQGKEELTEAEKLEFASVLELIKIITSDEVVTSYEVAAPKESLAVEEIKFQRSEGQFDSDAINKFLTQPPEITIPKSAQVERSEEEIQDNEVDSLFNIAEYTANSLSEEDFLSKKEKIESIISVAEALVDSGKIDKASLIIERAYEMVKTIPENEVSGLYANVAVVLAKLGRNEQALQITEEEIKHVYWESYWKSLSFSSIAKVLAVSDKLKAKKIAKKVFDIAKSIPDRSRPTDKLLRIEAFCNVIEALALADSQYLDEAFSIVEREFPGIVFDTDAEKVLMISYVSKAWSFVQAKRIRDDRVLSLLYAKTEEMKGEIHKLIAISKIAMALANTGRFHNALFYANEAIKIINNVKFKLYSDSGSYSGFSIAGLSNAFSDAAKVLAKLRMFDEALQIVEETKQLNGEDRALLLAYVAEILVDAGQFDRAGREVKKAIRIAATLDAKSILKVSILCAAGKALAKLAQARGQTSSAEVRPQKRPQELIEQAITQANTIDDPFYKSIALIPILKKLVQTGRMVEAKNLIKSISEDKRDDLGTEGIFYRAYLDAIAKAFRENNINMVINIATSDTSVKFKQPLLRLLGVYILVEVGAIDEAIKLIDSIGVIKEHEYKFGRARARIC